MAQALSTQQVSASSPSVLAASGLVFLITPIPGSSPPRSDLMALDAATGAVKWEKSDVNFSSPMRLLDGKLYIGSQEGAGSSLRGLDPLTGEELWTCRVGDDRGQLQPVAAADGLVYFMGFSQMYAADAGTGDIRWRVQAGGPLVPLPVVADDSICFVFGSAGTLYALPLPTR